MFTKSAARAIQILNSIEAYEQKLGSESPNLAKLKAFASNEHLSHVVPYELAKHYIDPEDPPQVSVYDDDGIIRTYRVCKLKTSHAGLIVFVLTDHMQDNPRTHIVFRGTKKDASVELDFEKPAPGYESFQANAQQILSQLEQILITLNYKQSTALYISGHSLGGALGQYCATALLKAITEALAQNAASSFLNIQSLIINHLHSAGIPECTYAESKEYATKIAAIRKLAIKICAVRVAGDPVQQSGQSNILHDATTDIAEVAVLKVRNNHEGWFSNIGLFTTSALTLVTPVIGSLAMLGFWYMSGREGFKAHTSHHFHDTALDEMQFEMYDNSTTEGQQTIQRKLTNQSIMLNNPVTSGIQTVLHAATKSRSNSPTCTSEQEPWEMVPFEPGKISASPESFQKELEHCIKQKLQQQKRTGYLIAIKQTLQIHQMAHRITLARQEAELAKNQITSSIHDAAPARDAATEAVQINSATPFMRAYLMHKIRENEPRIIDVTAQEPTPVETPSLRA